MATGAERARRTRERRMAEDLDGFRESERARAREYQARTYVPKPLAGSCSRCATAIKHGRYCGANDCVLARNRERQRRYIASFPEPLSVSLDHVVPVSLGGSHSRDNTRCAHFWCNSKRGNRASV